MKSQGRTLKAEGISKFVETILLSGNGTIRLNRVFYLKPVRNFGLFFCDKMTSVPRKLVIRRGNWCVKF